MSFARGFISSPKLLCLKRKLTLGAKTAKGRVPQDLGPVGRSVNRAAGFDLIQ